MVTIAVTAAVACNPSNCFTAFHLLALFATHGL